jgi:hypothetical protein
MNYKPVEEYRGFRIDRTCYNNKTNTDFYVIRYPDGSLSVMALTTIQVCKNIIDRLLKVEYEKYMYQAA